MLAIHSERSRAYCRVVMHWPKPRRPENRNSPGFLPANVNPVDVCSWPFSAALTVRHRVRYRTVTNPFMRGSASGRAQPAYAWPGSFKAGHEKRGGRKRGTPNIFSHDYKMAILEAAYRIGQDGNGKNGVAGYFLWLGGRHPGIFYTVLLVGLLQLELAESATPEEPRRTTEGMDELVRNYIKVRGKNRMKGQTDPVASQSPRDWTGQDFPVGGLMQLAIEDPKAFCKLRKNANDNHLVRRRIAQHAQ